MSPNRRRLRAAAFVLYGLAAAGTAALAQETSNTIGPPQLKDFSLPGQRTTPPAATPPAPATAQPATTIPPRTAPATAPAAGRERPAPRPAERRATAPAAASPAPAPSAQPLPPPVVTAPEVQPQPQSQPEPQPQATPPSAPRASTWLWPAAGGAVLLLLAGFLLLRRRRAAAAREDARDLARGELGGALLATPEAAPEPEPETPAAPRPWIELDIVPDRAAATDSEAVVHYALSLTNQGDADARNIRIDPRLFNAGAEGEMMAFFQGPIHEQSGSPHVVLPPGGSLKLNGQVAMPKAELREIEVGGRRIFVPMVAINVAYDWAGGGSGRTSRSWLVGREAESPSAKMGPFRLDLGPRIYRSVGRREARLVRV
jgi:LPXTG-motif cell wall-anchored protein